MQRVQMSPSLQILQSSSPTALPLILIKTFNQKLGGVNAPVEEYGDSDFEEIHLPEPENPAADSHCPLQEETETPAVVEFPRYRTHKISAVSKYPPAHNSTPIAPDSSTPVPKQQSASSVEKTITLSLSEKEKLLNWDLATPGTFSTTTAAERTERYRREPDTSINPQTHPECQAESVLSPVEPEPNPSVSGFQLWASVLRRSFSGATNNPKVIRRTHPHKARPLSEGSFSSSSLMGNQDRDTMSFGADTEESQSVTPSRSEITAMLEQVTLSNKLPGASKDDMASLPPRKLNFFSSMRLKRNEGAVRNKTDNQTKDILGILSKFRNKATLQQQQQRDKDDYLSSEEDQKSITQRFESRHSNRQRKQQQKTHAMQTRREQLKRLHRAQVIQRQLEEVEEKQRALEEKGVALEKVLRGESGDASADEAELLQSWFQLVLEKNKLTRYESELIIFAQELELEDRQSQLQQELRHRLTTEECEKSSAELADEKVLLDEVMKVVEERDQLVSLLEEQRLQEKAEDRDLGSLILSKGYQFHWS